MTAVESLTPAELRDRLAAGEELVLLDVRQPEELEVCRLEGARAIPLAELPRRVDELDPERATVCICHHGVRSAQAAALLAQAGFGRLFNLSGGVDRWAAEVDPSMARY